MTQNRNCLRPHREQLQEIPNPDKPEPKKRISRKDAKTLSFSLPLFLFATLRPGVRHFLAQWAKIPLIRGIKAARPTRAASGRKLATNQTSTCF